MILIPLIFLIVTSGSLIDYLLTIMIIRDIKLIISQIKIIDY